MWKNSLVTRLTFVPSCSACWLGHSPSLSSQYLALHETTSPSRHHTWWRRPAPCAFGSVWMPQSYWLCSESVASGHCLESPAQERERSRELIDQLESYLHQYAGIIISDKKANIRIFRFIMWREIFSGFVCKKFYRWKFFTCIMLSHVRRPRCASQMCQWLALPFTCVPVSAYRLIIPYSPSTRHPLGIYVYTCNLLTSGLSVVDSCINEEEGNLLPTSAWKTLCHCFDWML